MTLVIAGCSTLEQHASQEVTVYWEDPRIQFEGKGMGAGMALMSTMGPMGMAVGVAIDEGIGKDINENQRASGVAIQHIIEDSIQFESVAAVKWVNEPQTTHVDLKIDQLIFKLVPGQDDPACLHITGTVFYESTKRFIRLNYPSTNSEKPCFTTSLDDLKRKPKAVNIAVIKAFSSFANEYFFLLEESQ